MRRLLLIITFLVTSHLIGVAQTSSKDGWLRVQSENGEFSIEVPDEYSYFFDADGFIVADNQRDYAVRDMNLLSAYRDGTLVSVETYLADGGAMNGLLNATLERGVQSKKTKFNGIDLREVIRIGDKNSPAGDNFYFVSRYFKSKKFVYVVSGLSRDGETPIMTRFFESLKFDPEAEKPLVGVRRLAELNRSLVDVKDFVPSPQPDKVPDKIPKATPSPDPTSRKAVIASKPRASYVKKAREHNVMGAVRLRMLFSEKGYIPAIDIVTSLPDGLTRQSIFNALRLKFLPAEKGGKPVPAIRILEYTFSIY